MESRAGFHNQVFSNCEVFFILGEVGIFVSQKQKMLRLEKV